MFDKDGNENIDVHELKDAMKALGLNKDKEELFISFSRGTSEVRDLLEREKDSLAKKIEKQNKMSELFEKELDKNREDDEECRKEVDQLRSVMSELYSSVSRSCSVYFNAVRDEPYVTGGEEYLTFSSCTVNSGNAMDPKSGIFIAPATGKIILPDFPRMNCYVYYSIWKSFVHHILFSIIY